MKVLTLSVFFIFLSASVAMALPSYGANQRNSRLDAADAHASGAQQSMQGSTVKAMEAMMAMGQGNLSQAMTLGQESYSMYADAKLFNALSDENSVNAMASRSKLDPEEVFGFQFRRTSYANLDSKFLYQGNAAKVAKRFEQATGMKRDKFLRAMAQATDKPLPSGAGEYAAAFSRFKRFVDTIPSSQFRKQVKNHMRGVSVADAVTTISTAVDRALDLPPAIGMPSRAATAIASGQREQSPKNRDASADIPRQNSGAAKSSGLQGSQDAFKLYVASSAQTEGRGKQGLQPEEMAEPLSAAEMLVRAKQELAEQKNNETLFAKVSRRINLLEAEGLGR